MVSSGKDAGLGKTRSAMIRASDQTFFLHTLDEEYFVLLAANAGVLAGLARARLAAAVTALRRHV